MGAPRVGGQGLCLGCWARQGGGLRRPQPGLEFQGYPRLLPFFPSGLETGVSTPLIFRT